MRGHDCGPSEGQLHMPRAGALTKKDEFLPITPPPPLLVQAPLPGETVNFCAFGGAWTGGGGRGKCPHVNSRKVIDHRSRSDSGHMVHQCHIPMPILYPFHMQVMHSSLPTSNKLKPLMLGKECTWCGGRWEGVAWESVFYTR